VSSPSFADVKLCKEVTRDSSWYLCMPIQVGICACRFKLVFVHADSSWYLWHCMLLTYVCAGGGRTDEILIPLSSLYALKHFDALADALLVTLTWLTACRRLACITSELPQSPIMPCHGASDTDNTALCAQVK
jgi:hypothetical protein